jgi:hypothetical protein
MFFYVAVNCSCLSKAKRSRAKWQRNLVALKSNRKKNTFQRNNKRQMSLKSQETQQPTLLSHRASLEAIGNMA